MRTLPPKCPGDRETKRPVWFSRRVSWSPDLRSLRRHRPGYAFLVTVLVIGVMATATATSLMLLGWAAEQNGFLMERSAQAEEYAKGCIERTFRKLRLEPTYAGNETVTFPKGSCLIRSVAGDGINDRRVCVEGRSGQTIRRFQVEIEELFPRIRTASFAEVALFTLCP